MTAQLLDGEKLAGRIKMELADRASRLAAAGRPVCLGTILVGDDGTSAKYVAMKVAECKLAGEAAGVGEVGLLAAPNWDKAAPGVYEGLGGPAGEVLLLQVRTVPQTRQRLRPGRAAGQAAGQVAGRVAERRRAGPRRPRHRLRAAARDRSRAAARMQPAWPRSTAPCATSASPTCGAVLARLASTAPV